LSRTSRFESQPASYSKVALSFSFAAACPEATDEVHRAFKIDMDEESAIRHVDFLRVGRVAGYASEDAPPRRKGKTTRMTRS
jgi:hypothetical protein